MEVSQCPDGSSVGRDSANNCEFHSCPSGCVLTGGDSVISGWSGKDTGNNACNDCSCTDGALGCTLQFCVGCTLTGGDNVPSGWTGLDTGDNSCNTCRCENGVLGCTEMACQPAQVCTTEVNQCPDGSFVGRDSANNCEFHPCPTPLCCKALTAECLGCSNGLSAQEYCRTIDSSAIGCQTALKCDTDAGCQPDEHCRQAIGGNGFSPCQDYKTCVMRVAIGETCGGLVLPCTLDKCHTGLVCKENDQDSDLGVCVEELVKETCVTPVKKWDECLGQEKCCEAGTYCKRFSQWYAQCKPL